MFLVSCTYLCHQGGGGLQMQHFLKYQQWLLWNMFAPLVLGDLCHVGRGWVEIESLGFRKRNMAGFWDHAGTWDFESCVETDAHLPFSTIFWFLCFPNHHTDSTQIPVNSDNEVPDQNASPGNHPPKAWKSSDPSGVVPGIDMGWSGGLAVQGAWPFPVPSNVKLSVPLGEGFPSHIRHCNIVTYTNPPQCAQLDS